MVKRVKKKAVEKKIKPKSPPPRDPCFHKGCKNVTAYMKRNRKTGDYEHWCAPHWKSDVEAKDPERYRSEYSVSEQRRRAKRRVKKSGTSASKRVVKRSK